MYIVNVRNADEFCFKCKKLLNQDPLTYIKSLPQDSEQTLQERYGAYGEKGRIGEELVASILKEEAGQEVIDLERTMLGQTLGVDFVINKPRWKRPYFVEVKSNMHNGTFFVELLKADNTPGWFQTSIADRFYFVDVEKKHVVRMDAKSMRRYVTLYDPEIKTTMQGATLAVIDQDAQKFIKQYEREAFIGARKK